MRRPFLIFSTKELLHLHLPISQHAMMETLRPTLVLVAVPMLLAADRPLPDPAHSPAGRYFSQFADGRVTGEKYTGEDIVEVVPVASHAAYIRVHLDYYNGHTCGIYEVASSRAMLLLIPIQSQITRTPGAS